jgi:TonB family protein
MPDKDGVYAVGPGVVSPIVVERAPVTYPSNPTPGETDGTSLLSLVIDSDGTPSNIQVLQSHGAASDAAAIEAIKLTKFQPGSVDGRPAPVRIFARTRFSEDQRPTYPRILSHLGPIGSAGPPMRPYDKPPVALYAPNAQYSDRARKAKLNGYVLISLLVTEDGLPTDLKVVKSLGMGLDENALECVSKYRFKPATKDGVPVPTHISVEVIFQLY